VADDILGFEFPDAEFVFALVSPVGTDTGSIQIALENGLKRFGYKVNTIRISDFLKRFNLSIDLPDDPQYDRVRSRMDAGNEACKQAGRNDFLALVAVSEINKARSLDTTTKLPTPRTKTAHILSTLKRPEEVVALRRIYGAGFLLIGVFATEEERFNYLTNDLNIPANQAQELITRDTGESDPHGQSTRDTFHLADVFVRLKGDTYKKQLWRFLDLLFGNAFETPTRDEHAMFLAYSAALRSADLSRQVGATVLSKDCEVIGLGCNDVPRSGGGLYWPGKDDYRDYARGFDTNESRRDEFIVDVMTRLRPDIPSEERLQKGKELLLDSPMLDITEFGRAVHAEMDSIITCTRSGMSPRGGTLYCTTFPCHNCTKHIIAAGISRVVYIEPYPKSRAEDLHSDAIRLEEHGEESGKGHPRVNYQPFVGVGPRRYADLFSLVLNSGKRIIRKESGKKKNWERTNAMPRVPMLPNSYLQRELIAIGKIEATMKKLGEEEKQHGNEQR